MERLIRLLPTILLAGFITALVVVCWLAPGRTANEAGIGGRETTGATTGVPTDVSPASLVVPGRTTNETGAGGVEGSVGQSAERTAGPNRTAAVGDTGQEVGLTAPVSLAVTAPRLYRNHSAAYWAWRYRQRTRQLQEAREKARETRRALLSRSSVSEAINLAGAIYGYGSTLWRKAQCETGGTFSPYAHNPSGASGLFQFLPSTWRTTPFAGFSIWSPYANALAAGWMHARGRGGEWSCR